MSALRSLLLLLLPLSLGPGPGPGPGSEAKVTRSCTETRQVLGARGYSLSLLPPVLISGEHLRICPQEYTCCSSEIEQRLTWETEATFRGLVEESGSFLVHTLAARHRKFDEVFREMLSSSEHSLALLFQRSYGRLYSQYSPLFSGLFSRLRDYYERSSEGLDDALVDFWAQLLERMFPLLHPQYIFSPDYLFCLTRLASSADDSLKPFGDSPRRLRLQITRALVAARAFIQGLETGRDVVREALKVPMSEGCRRAVMRLTGCPLCRGVPSLPPCRGFCLNVAHGCLSSQGMDPDWGAYLDGLLFLAEKLQGPFSFELAAQSIGVKISEGLMYLQENSVGVSAQVFQECGSPQPAPARARRAPAPREEADRLWTAAAAEERPTTAAGTSLPRLVWELRERLGRVRGFWAGLPLTVCGDPRMAADISQEAAPCWTGAERGRYLSPVVGGSQTEQLNNPELDAESSSPDLQTRRRRLQLRAATTRMRAAALGRDLDLEDWDEDASGSGEGQHYADDWMAGAAAVAPPARPPRPPRRDGAGGKGGGVIVRHNQGKTRTGGTSVGFHTQPILILFLSALALLGPR
ncbi:PREDICTED: glypican-2 [Ceratotherium simum simum]|uniref:Glypican-2 n=1 Tax=Ceratotherium simum simum TaxID=73337 RepID=A0ABM0I909_CERSS|nr:PREDICTED: glypican-2 [Ceratotherium simum simum]